MSLSDQTNFILPQSLSPILTVIRMEFETDNSEINNFKQLEKWAIC